MNDNNQNLFVPNDDGNIVMQNSTPEGQGLQSVMSEPQVSLAPQVETSPQMAPTPVETPMQSVMEQNNYPNPQPMNNLMPEYNQNMNIQPQGGGSNDLMKNKKVLIIGAVVLLIIIGVILYFTVFKKSDKIEKFDYLDYEKQQQEIEDRINNNYLVKDYKINNGILLELKNNNKEIVNAEITVEFYDETNNPINVEKGYMFYVPGNGVGYDKISLFDDKNNYSTYKITVKLKDATTYTKAYNDKVKIVSSNAQGDYYIFQIKNESDVKLDGVEVGALFYGPNNTILDFEVTSFDDVAVGATTTGKVSIPYDYNMHDNIVYEKVDFKILGANANIDIK